MAEQSLPLTNSKTKICSVPDCGKPFRARGVCHMHYDRLRRYGTTDPQPLSRVGVSQVDKFWSNVAMAGPDECWEWQRFRNTKGYGECRYEKQNYLSHRVAWWIANGREPVLDVLHSCDNPPCCNPAHLREGTHQENMRDRVLRGRSLKTHCKRGHELSGDNVRPRPNGGRRCVPCTRIHNRETERHLLDPSMRNAFVVKTWK